MKERKRPLALVLALFLALSLCACGASGGAARDSYASYSQNAAADYDMAAPEAAEAPMESMPEEELSASGLAAGGDVDLSQDQARVDPEKIIYSADVTVETTAFDQAVADVARLMEDYGGWIESSSVNDANYYSRARGYASNRSASYTLRVPSEKFNALMSGLSVLGNVPYTHTYSENVSAQYYDVRARLTAYTAQETRLLEMMEQAETVADVIAIEEELTELRYQIESLQSTLNNYDRRVNYSSIYLSLEEVQEYTPETPVELSYGQRLGLAVSRGFKNAGDFFQDLLLFLAGSIPSLLFLAVIAVFTVLAVKKARARRRARTAPPDPPQKDGTPKV